MFISHHRQTTFIRRIPLPNCETYNRPKEVFDSSCPGTDGSSICHCVSLSWVIYFFFLNMVRPYVQSKFIWHPHQFTSLSKDLLCSCIFSQMKEIIHILPPVCEPTTYLDLFFTKVKGLFSSRFRRTYMVQSVFEDTAGKIAVSLQNQGV